jgi:hypothetical protein
MITLTAKMRIQGENPIPFVIGESAIGDYNMIGDYIVSDVKFDKRNLISLESGISSRGDLEMPRGGIISNAGSISFRDTNFRFRNYANAGLLKNGIKTEIFLNNSLKDKHSLVGTYYTSDWNYDNENQTVSVSLKDDLEEWQDIQVGEMKLKPEMTVLEILNYIKARTPSKFTFEETPLLISLTTICKFPYLQSGSLWSQWEKICEIAQLCIYKNEENNVVISSIFNIGS